MKASPSANRMRVQLPLSERRILLMVGDTVAVVLAALIALRIWTVVGRIRFDLNFLLPNSYWLVLLPSLWLFLASANDFYNLRVTARLGTSMVRMVQITMQQVLVYLVLFFFVERNQLPRLFILYHAVISFVLVAAWRIWRPFLIGWAASKRRALVIGTGWAAETIIKTIMQEAASDYELLGVVTNATDQAERTQTAGVPFVGTGMDLPVVAAQLQIDELIIASGAEIPSDIFQGIMACYEQGMTLVPMSILYEEITGRVPIEHIGQQQWLIVLPLDNQTLSFRAYLLFKRMLDIVLAVIGLSVFSLLLPLLATIMWLDSRGPIFFAQDRTGKGGKVFKVFKLRSMIPDAELQSGAVWATVNDPRITRFGRFLRKSRLDEVPQLWNVLRGEMSIVGPRPERPVFVDQLTQQIPFYRTRLVVNPGLTGWAQVSYKYGNTSEDALIKLQYDLYYIRHQSVTLDLQIMFRTVGKMLAMQGT